MGIGETVLGAASCRNTARRTLKPGDNTNMDIPGRVDKRAFPLCSPIFLHVSKLFSQQLYACYYNAEVKPYSWASAAQRD